MEIENETEIINNEKQLETDLMIMKNNKNKKIKLLINDGFSIDVPDYIYNHSDFLKDMFIDNDVNDNEVRLDVDIFTLNKVLEFYTILNEDLLKINSHNEKLSKILNEESEEYIDINCEKLDIEDELEQLYDIDKPLKSTNMKEIFPEKYASFIDFYTIDKIKDLTKLVIFTNKYLMEILYNMICAKIASYVQEAKTDEEKKKILGITEDEIYEQLTGIQNNEKIICNNTNDIKLNDIDENENENDIDENDVDENENENDIDENDIDENDIDDIDSD